MSIISYYRGPFKRTIDNIFTPTGQAIAGLGIKPNHLTAMQLPSAVIMFYYLLHRNLELGIFFLFIALLCDGLDGLVARVSKQETRLGHLFDKGSDLFCITLMLIGIAAYSPLTRNLCIALGIINVFVYTTNEIRKPEVYTCARDAGIIGLVMLNLFNNVSILNFWIGVSIALGGSLLLVKIYKIAMDEIIKR